jgi:putative ABC transport system permease protein
MLKNYLKIAIRHFLNQKHLSFINIFGLSVGIACFSLFMLYAVNEFSYDSFHKNASDIFRVYTTAKQNIDSKNPSGFNMTAVPLGPAMKKDLPDIKDYVRYIQPFEAFIKNGEQNLRENISFADPSFFSVFSFKLTHGNPMIALKDVNSVVLTEETAKKIFGSQDAIGKSFQIKVEDRFDIFTVTAIAEDPPTNTSLPFAILANFDYFITRTEEGKASASRWSEGTPYITYVQLNHGSTLADNKKKLADFRHKYFPESNSTFKLEPIENVHTDTGIVFYNKVPPVNPKAIWILLSIASGVLLIACINFTTLSIGRSAIRAKEIGLRKVIGGTKKNLIFQFLSESILLSVISAAIGLLLANLLLPYFNQLSGKELQFSFEKFPQLIWLFTGLTAIVGILSGSYPAFVLSGFKTLDVLKKKIKVGGANVFTKTLVTVQFALSAGLIIMAIIITQQLHYMQSRDPGFNKENVIVVEAYGVADSKKTYSLFRHELAAHPEIAGTASSDNGLGDHEGMSTTEIGNNGQGINITEYSIDPDYIPLLGMDILAGRNFNPAIASDTVSSIIINEALMHKLGLTLNNSVGQMLKGFGPQYRSGPVVIGVVKDFNYSDLRQHVEPQLFSQFSNAEPHRFFVKIKPGNPSKALASIQHAWKVVAPDYPLKYNFLSEDLDRFYKSESTMSNIVGWASGISIFLACLGLFGLASLAAVNRIKEIGIRKVLGASITGIMGLLSKDFIKLVVIGLFIAVPASWYVMDKWLQDYAYRIDISWWIFGIITILTILIALATVSYQSIKAATTNPVVSLRAE